MADDTGIGILCRQILQEIVHRRLLGCRTGIVGLAVDIEAALIADAERTVVVVASVGSTDILGQDGDDLAIHADVVVVTGLAEAGNTCVDQVFHAERAANLRC